MKKEIFSFYLIILLVFVLQGCGHKGAPTGGKKDVERPRVLTITPDQYSQLNSQEINILFSKPIEKKSIFSGITIYPPILKKSYLWEGDNLIIKIEEELLDSTNYCVSLSTSIMGIHKNRLDKNYTFVFYNGAKNDYVVSGVIEYEDIDDSGKAISVTLLSADTTFICKKNAKAYFYFFEDLNPEDYIIRAFIDKNSNEAYDSKNEPFANIYAKYLPDSRNLMRLAYADTSKPKLKSAKIESSTQLYFTFSEDILKPENIRIFRDSSDVELNILATVLNENKISIISAEMDTLNYRVSIDKIEDFKENFVDDVSLVFKGKTVLDTIPPEVVFTNPRNGSTIETLEPNIVVDFSEIILTENMKAQLFEVESGKQVDIDIVSGNSDRFVFKPKNKLKNWSSYRLELYFSDYKKNFVKEKFSMIFIPIIRN